MIQKKFKLINMGTYSVDFFKLRFGSYISGGIVHPIYSWAQRPPKSSILTEVKA
jgi:hypothetical protein